MKVEWLKDQLYEMVNLDSSILERFHNDFAGFDEDDEVCIEEIESTEYPRLQEILDDLNMNFNLTLKVKSSISNHRYDNEDEQHCPHNKNFMFVINAHIDLQDKNKTSFDPSTIEVLNIEEWDK